MCGILGYIGKRSFNVEAFGRALDVMAKRGPDDRGIYEEPEVLLGHRRLAILDLSPAGHQPMVSADSRYIIVYNGEVYNYMELRKDLEKEGVCFRSTSDTEVILELYARQGPKCLGNFRGMFAIAIWDQKEKTLFLARDRMGIKPLYFWRFPGGIAFASEVKALRALPGGPREINPTGVYEYLAWGSMPEPLTILKGVNCMPPGTWALFGNGDLKQSRYWDFPIGPAVYKTRNEAVEVLRPLLKEAVALRCIADVPVGAFLSGGIDSSSVVSLMREAGQKEICTFSISFPQTDLDEGPYALKVAEQFGTLHTDVSVTEQMVRDELEGFFNAMDQPTCDGVNTYLVSKFAKQGGVTVSLSGLGGDELFGGYPSFRRAAKLVPWLRRFPHFTTNTVAKCLSLLNGRYAKLEAFGSEENPVAQVYRATRGLFAPSQIKNILIKDLWEEIDQEKNKPIQDLDSFDTVHGTIQLELRRYMHNQLLKDSDVFGMAHALEIRVPLIDHKIVEEMFKIAPDLILDGSQKGLLLDALPSPLPRLCTHRPKMGFTFPFEIWVKGPWRDLMEDAFTNNNPIGSGRIINKRELATIWKKFLNGNIHWSSAWSLYVLSRHLSN